MTPYEHPGMLFFFLFFIPGFFLVLFLYGLRNLDLETRLAIFGVSMVISGLIGLWLAKVNWVWWCSGIGLTITTVLLLVLLIQEQKNES